MNTSVKKLNSLDPPVPTLELIFVRMVSGTTSRRLDGMLNSSGYYLDMLCYLHVRRRPLISSRCRSLITARRYATNVPHPLLGPPGVRLLLAFRGFVG